MRKSQFVQFLVEELVLLRKELNNQGLNHNDKGEKEQAKVLYPQHGSELLL